VRPEAVLSGALIAEKDEGMAIEELVRKLRLELDSMEHS
jgi:hypothetical protein